jgi:hypothetical protein
MRTFQVGLARAGAGEAESERRERTMLALTDRAAQTIGALTDQPGVPEDAALRISSSAADDDPTGEGATLEITLVEDPDEGERAIEDPPVYVEPGLASEFLEDKVLDAEIGQDQVRFSIAQQPTISPPGVDGRPKPDTS